MNFKVQIKNFEGPIGILLQLIEKRKMSISDVSLVDITDDYINFVRSLKDRSLSDTTYFVFVASTLTLIKSKSLLPNLELTDEEEGDIESLKRRIEILETFKDASRIISTEFSERKSFYYPKPAKRKIIFSPHKNISKKQILESIKDILLEFPVKEATKKEASIKIAVHIDEMMKSLEKRINKILKTDFKSFIQTQTGEQKDRKSLKVYNVVGFLAMLELVKDGALEVLQSKNFDSILIESAQQQNNN